LSLILFYIIFLFSITASVVVLASQIKLLWYYYIIFTIAILSIVYCVYLSVRHYYVLKQKLKSKIIEKNKFTFLINYNIRSIIFSTFTFTINAVYSVFIGVLAIMSRSLWYGALTIFYVMISVARGTAILKYNNLSKNKFSHIETQLKKTKTYKNCGIAIILLTTALAFFVIEMILNPEPFRQAQILIYPVGIYTIYKVTLAIINIFKAKKHDDIIVQATRNLNLAAVMVSILTLQTNLFQLFVPNYDSTVVNAITGAICCTILMILGVVMIIQANKKLENFYHITKK